MNDHQQLRPLENKLTLIAIALGAVALVSAVAWSPTQGRGYQIKASDGMIGYICDFLMDDQSWVLQKLVIKIGNRFSGKAVQISTSKVDRISYEESTVFVNLSQAAIEQSPQHPLASAGLAA